MYYTVIHGWYNFQVEGRSSYCNLSNVKYILHVHKFSSICTCGHKSYKPNANNTSGSYRKAACS